MNSAMTTSNAPLRSQLANDPEMVELIDLYLGELPKRADCVLEAWRGRQLKRLERLAHQLKGSSAGYGFPTITTAAAKVEDCLKTGSEEQATLSEVAAGVQELIDLCRRAASGGPSAKAA